MNPSSLGHLTIRPTPLPKWVLDRLVACDEVYPGVLRRFFTTSNLRRQCICLALSNFQIDDPKKLADRLRPSGDDHGNQYIDAFALIGHAILTYRARNIVRTLYPGAQGLIGILTKLGAEPLNMQDYRALVELHTQPRHRSRLNALRQIKRITPTIIQTVLNLEPPYALHSVVRRIQGPEAARDFARTIELIKRINPQAGDHALVASLKALGTTSSIADWVNRWLGKATQFLVRAPMPDDDAFKCLSSASKMKDAGRRFGNCLETKIGAAALSRTCFIEYRPIPTIIELARLNRGFLLDGLYGPSNARPDPSALRAIYPRLEAAGVLMFSRQTDAVARLAGIYDFSRNHIDILESADENPDCELRAA